MTGLVSTRALLTLAQAAEYLAVHRKTVRRLVDTRGLPVVRMGTTARGWRFRREAIDAWIAGEESACRSGTSQTQDIPANRGSRKSTATVAALDDVLGPSEKPPRLSVVSKASD